MPLRFRHRIIEHLSHEAYRPQTARDIARDLRVESDEREVFDEAIRLLAEERSLEVDAKGMVRLPGAGDEVTGVIRITGRGFGFIVPDTPIREGDIFVPPDNVHDAVSGDRVRAKLMRKRSRFGGAGDETIGRVVEVLERGRAMFTGTLHRERNQWIVDPDGRLLQDAVIIRDPHAKNAREGDKVVIEITQYPKGGFLAEGVILEVLGEAGRPSVETKAVIVAHGLRDSMPEPALDEARRAARQFEREAGHAGAGEASTSTRRSHHSREDIRHLFTITIDPPDAKDFDDAISIDFNRAAEEWTLGVHIADVAHFVRPGSAMDEEAYERGNSVYLPRLVLPMLPEALSNGVCSLQEGVPRFTKTAFISYDAKGRVTGQRLCSTIIQSDKRLTYLEAQALIDGDEAEARKHARTEPTYTAELIETLHKMDRLAKTLRERRRRDGMIALNLPQVELRFDDEGHVIDVVPEDDAFTHTLIEMFMVEANEAVARAFDDLGVPIIRRIHPDPSVGKMDVLRMYSLVAGIRIPESPTRHDVQRLLDATRDLPAARAIHFAVLRTLTKASYSPALIGHYALASDHYTHFTSPIRRYADLLVHRALDALLDLTDNGRHIPGGRKKRDLGGKVLADDRVRDEGELIAIGRHITDTEVEAEAAERELRGFLVMQFLREHHLGDTFAGVVTGVLSGGVFVSIEKYLVEGMVKAEDLPQGAKFGDRWSINERTGRLTSRRTGASIGAGDEVMVKIVAIDLPTRRMDLHIVEAPHRGRADAGPRAKGATPPKKRHPPKSKHKASHRGGEMPRRGHGHGKGRRGRKGRP